MLGITAKELDEMLQSSTDIQLIDVREDDEHEEFNIGGLLVPLAQVVQRSAEIEKDKPVVVYCRKGIRSQFAIQRLMEIYPYKNLLNLIGGTEALKKTVMKV